MPRPKTITDREILDAARAVFMQHGVHASTQLVADRVGLAQPTLFQRFGDKASLLVAALALEPIDPEKIIGAPEEPEELGHEKHLNALALRLLDQVVTVVSVIEVISGGQNLRPEAVQKLHAAPGIETLVKVLSEHLRKLGQTQSWKVEALLLMVHGAAFMAVHAPSEDQESIRSMLSRAISGTLGGAEGSL